MKIIITGVAGFIGSNLALRLLRERGHHVVGIDNLSYGIREQVPDGVDFYEADIRDKEIYKLFTGGDVVFHLAAKNCISDCQSDPHETTDINVTGTVNIFEAARRAEVRKVVYAESSALYEGSAVFPTPESELRPRSFYALSKAASMYFANAYRMFHGMRITALRYFCVYGPRQDYRRTVPPVMSSFIIKLLKGEAPLIYGTGEKRRDFVYVDDINDFHMLSITDRRTDGNTYNIGSGTNYSVNEVYGAVSGILGIHIPAVHKPDLPGEAEITLADITAARNLGWRPRTELTQGLSEMIKYIRGELRAGRCG